MDDHMCDAFARICFVEERVTEKQRAANRSRPPVGNDLLCELLVPLQEFAYVRLRAVTGLGAGGCGATNCLQYP